MKVRMLAHLQTDGSVHLIPAEDVKDLINSSSVGTNLKFTVVETERSKLEKAPRIGNAYRIRRSVTGGFDYDDGFLDAVLLLSVLDELSYDYDSDYNDNDTGSSDTPVVESCGTEEDTTRSSESSYSSQSESSYSSSSDDSSSDSGGGDCGGGDD